MDIKNILDGYKVFLGGIGMIAAGISIIAPAWAAGDFAGPVEGYALFGNGLGLWGIGQKFEKAAPKKK